MSESQNKPLSLGPAPTAEQLASQRQAQLAQDARRLAGQQRLIAQKATAHAERAVFLASLMAACFDAGFNVSGVDENAVELRVFRGDSWAGREGGAHVSVSFPYLTDCAGFRSVPHTAESVTALVREPFGVRKGKGTRCRVQVREGRGDVGRIVSLALANL